MPLVAPRKRETVQDEARVAMDRLGQRIQAVRTAAAAQAGPLAQAVVELAQVVERLRVWIDSREELERR